MCRAEGDELSGFFEAVMSPLYWLVSLVLSGAHHALSWLLPADSGVTWAIALVVLTAVIRAALFPLFARQIRSGKALQQLQPELRRLKELHGKDKDKLAEETMALYKAHGINPFASCLPILLQVPFFIALFWLINGAAKGEDRGVLSAEQVDSLSHARLFGVPFADTLADASGGATYVLAGSLVVVLALTAVLQQRQLTRDADPTFTEGTQHKVMTYFFPLLFAVLGATFPVGLLVYWTASNLWTLGQQGYLLDRTRA